MPSPGDKLRHAVELWTLYYSTLAAWLILFRKVGKMWQQILRIAMQIWTGNEIVKALEVNDETDLPPGSFREHGRKYIFTIHIKRVE